MKNLVLKTVLFLTIFTFMLSLICKILVFPGENRDFNWIEGFYKEKANNLDAVFVGGSVVYVSWMSTVAWNKYGITVYPFASSSQPFQATKYIVKEARKTQPDALYIVTTNGTYYDSFSNNQIYWLSAPMPFSMNRFHLINELCDVNGTHFKDREAFYFPLFQFHSRWKDLDKADFHDTASKLKGGSVVRWFFSNNRDVTHEFMATPRRTPLPDALRESFEDFLDYCDKERVRVLFVTLPQAKGNEYFLAELNTINDLVQARGYPHLDLSNHIDEIPLDFSSDFAEKYHTNIHGALKITKFIAEYIVKNYDITDKRGNPKYADWNSAYERYLKIIAPYVLDIETNFEQRDYSLSAPNLNNINVNGTTLTVSWKASDGAEGYRIYRKEGDSAWKTLAELDDKTLQYVDRGRLKDRIYTYTVVPWRTKDGTKVWGKFNAVGVKAKALLNAPHLVSVVKTDKGIKVIWKKVKGADGYKIFRRLPERNWILIGKVKDIDYYVDTAVLDNLPFLYTVRGYTEKDSKNIDGSQNGTGILYLPKLNMPTATANVNQGQVNLSWDSAEGVGGYMVYRKTAETNWLKIADTLPSNSTGFTDTTIPASGQYTYRVEAFFKVGMNVYSFDLNNSFNWIDVNTKGFIQD